jgi:hypothetical protein
MRYGNVTIDNYHLTTDYSGPLTAIFSPGADTAKVPTRPEKDQIACWRGMDDKVRCMDSSGRDATAPLGEK